VGEGLPQIEGCGQSAAGHAHDLKHNHEFWRGATTPRHAQEALVSDVE
jgi:hypothetical protein